MCEHGASQHGASYMDHEACLRSSYNLVVLPYARVAKAFPRALEAVIVRPSTPPDECERAWELRRQLMLEYGLDGGLAAPPVLIYDPAARHAFTTTGQGCGGG